VTDPAQIIADRILKHIKGKIKPHPVANNTASRIGHPCDRYLYLLRTAWDELQMHDVGLQTIFDEGNLHERAVKRLLEDTGLDVDKSQAVYWNRKRKLTAHIDGAVPLAGTEYPLEIKSVSTHYFRTITSFESLIYHKKWFVRGWADQMQVYLHLMKRPEGIMIFKDKNCGEIKIINVKADRDHVERLLLKCDRINLAVRVKKMPDPMPWDEAVCGRCGFRPQRCTPDVINEGYEIKIDDELEAWLEEWDILKSAGTRFEDLTDLIKAKCKGRVIEMTSSDGTKRYQTIDGIRGFCGGYLVDGQWVNGAGGKPYWKPTFKKLEEIRR
jgi:hypothetical protein